MPHDVPLEQAQRDVSAGNLGSAIRALQRVGATSDRETLEAMASLAADIRDRTSRRRERVQAEAIISHAKSAIWRVENPVDAWAKPIAVLYGCTVLGGYGFRFPPEARVDMRFLTDYIELVELRHDHGQPVRIPYDNVGAFEIGGPGARRRGGRFLGGGFGVQGAAEGMLVATALNLLTARTSINTVICLRTSEAELFLHNGDETPDALRIRLARVFSILRTRETADDDDPIEQLERLAKLREAGVLTDEEFHAARDPLVQRLTRDGRRTDGT